jgi:hypothetical protein
MIKETSYIVDDDLYQQCIKELPNIDFKLTLNNPTSDFFYDSWEIKSEFKNTVWEKVLNTLPKSIGEARLIKLDPGNCYFSHCDIDDRYHLTLTGKKSYLVNLDDEKMYALKNERTWYTMDASFHHSAVNFGDIPRIQLVVRQLLNKNNIEDFKKVNITLDVNKHDYRYEFDDIISPWLNFGCKKGFINNFNVVKNVVSFDLHSSFVDELYKISNNKFNITAT